MARTTRTADKEKDQERARKDNEKREAERMVREAARVELEKKRTEARRDPGAVETLILKFSDGRNVSRKMLEEAFDEAREKAEDPKITSRVREYWRRKQEIEDLEASRKLRNKQRGKGVTKDVNKIQNDKEQKQAELKEFEGEGKGSEINVQVRRDLHATRKEAEEQYEDFLYLPSARYLNRREKLDDILPEDQLESGSRAFALWGTHALDQNFALELMQQCDDRMKGIGPPLDRIKVDLDDRVILEDELYLWNPLPRYRHGGLGREWPPHTDPRHGRRPEVLQLAEESIEAQRQEIEDRRGEVNVEEGKQGWANHSQRRAKEEELANEQGADPLHRHRKRLGIGYHASAKEQSHDWPTSYDLQGLVKPSFSTVVASAFNEARREKAQAIKDLKKLEQSDSEWRKQREEIEKAYSQEVERVYEKYHGKDENHFVDWAEETYGRRDFHAHGWLTPGSPVDSPPHSPRAGNGDDNYNDDDDSDGSDINFQDDYGLTDPDWPRFESKRLGHGHTIPYAPWDVKIIPNSERRRDAETKLSEWCTRYADFPLLPEPAMDGYSMMMCREIAKSHYPVYEEPRYAASNPSTDVPVHLGPESTPSEDDEEDLFTKSYRACSRSAPPDTSPKSSRPHDRPKFPRGSSGEDEKGSDDDDDDDDDEDNDGNNGAIDTRNQQNNTCRTRSAPNSTLEGETSDPRREASAEAQGGPLAGSREPENIHTDAEAGKTVSPRPQTRNRNPLKRPLPTTEASNDRPSKRVATGGSSKKRSPGKNPG
jgi:hypothetical protein